MALYQKELEVFGNKFIKILNDNELIASFDDTCFRDYLLQINIRNKLIKLGKINVYYKPSKKSYSLTTTNIKDKEAIEIINKCWDKANGFETFEGDSGIYEAFVDGSFIEGKTGYGAVIFLGDKKIKEFSGSIEDTSTRQFGGELFSVMEVLKWCKENNIQKIRINYDYLGIEYFVNGKWQPKNNLAKEYKQTVSSSNINILWRKIDSHTGNKKNDIADKLAKDGATKNWQQDFLL
jgi:ribonuclease HI